MPAAASATADASQPPAAAGAVQYALGTAEQYDVSWDGVLFPAELALLATAAEQLSSAPLRDGDLVLDAGFGAGRLLDGYRRALPAAALARFVAVDHAPDMLARSGVPRAASLAAAVDADARPLCVVGSAVASMADACLARRAALVLSTFAMCAMVAEPRVFYDAAAKALRPGGALVMHSPVYVPLALAASMRGAPLLDVTAALRAAAALGGDSAAPASATHDAALLRALGVSFGGRKVRLLLPSNFAGLMQQHTLAALVDANHAAPRITSDAALAAPAAAPLATATLASVAAERIAPADWFGIADHMHTLRDVADGLRACAPQLELRSARVFPTADFRRRVADAQLAPVAAVEAAFFAGAPLPVADDVARAGADWVPLDFVLHLTRRE